LGAWARGWPARAGAARLGAWARGWPARAGAARAGGYPFLVPIGDRL